MLGSAASKDWEKASQALKRFAKRSGEPAEKATGLLDDLGARKGAFVVDLTTELRVAAEAEDWEGRSLRGLGRVGLAISQLFKKADVLKQAVQEVLTAMDSISRSSRTSPRLRAIPADPRHIA